MSTATQERPAPFRSARSFGRIVMAAAAILLLALGVLGWHWSREPAVPPEPLGVADAVVGDRMTRTLIDVAGVLLDKPGGYLSNDVLPPGVWLDNMPNWEFGVLVQIRDLARALRNDFSRSQSQSREDPDLAIAEPQFNFDSESWLFPPSEGEYRQGIRAVERYRKRLVDPEQPDAQFYARSDNLRSYLAIVEKRLGDLSQRLSASAGVAQDLLNFLRVDAQKVLDQVRALADVSVKFNGQDVPLLSDTLDGIVAEFGVNEGGSISYIAKRMPKRSIDGFDSFEGLPEGWSGNTMEAGYFNRGGKLPKVPSNVRLHPGWFSDSLPPFVAANPGAVAFLHVDCDLYSSTACIFEHLGARIVPGTVIVFDEYFNYPAWQTHEHKAFREFTARTGKAFEYIGYSFKQVAVVMK